jgi:hypothetical protein
LAPGGKDADGHCCSQYIGIIYLPQVCREGKIMESQLPLKKPDKIKKPYTAPKLVVYGNIEKMTRTSGMTGLMLDSHLLLKTN